MMFSAVAIAILALIVLFIGTALLDSAQWHYCPVCKSYWRWYAGDLQRSTPMPCSCDGSCKTQSCPHCT